MMLDNNQISVEQFLLQNFPMRKILFTIAVILPLLISNVSWGYDLPKCDGSPEVESNIFATMGWDNCYGVYYFSDGDIYEGEFKDGLSSGNGTYTYQNGDIYVGEFKRGLAHGIGTYTFAGGREKYTGNWKDDKRHGKGINTHSTGQEYVGEYERGVRNGYGILSLENGDRYVGNFKDDRYHGQGTYTFVDGAKYEGIWREGEFLYENISVMKEDEKFCQEIGFTINTPEYDNCVQKLAEKD